MNPSTGSRSEADNNNRNHMINPFKFLELVIAGVLVLILLPTFLLILPFLWPIAWILSQIFPDHNFLPGSKR